MIRLTRLTLREISLPLKEPFRISSGEVTTRRILLVRIEDADGYHAWAECVAGGAPNYSPETIDTARLALTEWIAPRILGHTIASPKEVHDTLQRDFRGHRMAKAVVEMGSWAIEAERSESSLANLLGGDRDRVEVGISIGIQDNPEALVERAAAALAEGYRKIKIKIRPGADLPCLEAVRETLGPDAPLMVDANNAYMLADIDVLLAIDAFNLIMIEQPLAWDDMARHADLQARLQTPVCLDESITSLERAEDMLTLRAGRIINIKPGRVGGFSESRAIHDLCRKSGIPVWCGGMLESGIGRAYNVALASLPGFKIPGDTSPSARYWERDIVDPEWAMDADGTMAVPRDRPGIGVTVNEDRIDDLTVWSTTLEA